MAYGVALVQDRRHRGVLARLATCGVVLGRLGSGEYWRRHDECTAGARRDDGRHTARPFGYTPGLAARGRKQPECGFVVAVGIGVSTCVGVRPLGHEDHGSVGQERRTSFSGRSPGESSRRRRTLGIDLPQRSPVLLPVSGELVDGDNESAAVRCQPQAGDPAKCDVVVEGVERSRRHAVLVGGWFGLRGGGRLEVRRHGRQPRPWRSSVGWPDGSGRGSITANGSAGASRRFPVSLHHTGLVARREDWRSIRPDSSPRPVRGRRARAGCSHRLRAR